MSVHEVEVFVVVDSDGNAVASTDRTRAGELFDEDIGSDAGTARRLVRVVLHVPVAEEVVLTGDVPEEGAAVLTVG